MPNSLPNPHDWTGPGVLGGDPGLQLWVRGGVPKDGYIPMGEIASVREDMLCGSLRVMVRVVGGGRVGGGFFLGT